MTEFHEHSLDYLRAQWWKGALRTFFILLLPMLVASWIFSYCIYHSAQFAVLDMKSQAATANQLARFTLPEISVIMGVVGLAFCTQMAFWMNSTYPTRHALKREREATEIAKWIVSKD